MNPGEAKVAEAEMEKPPPEIDWGSEKLKKAQRSIDEHKYDLEAWSMLIREAQLKWIGDTRHFFERLVTTFPSTGRYWKIYIELEMKARNFEKVEKLFQRCLIKVLNIDLWKLYLAYVKETKASLPTFKEKMAQAYDFAIDKIGMDISSYPIWNDYVNFLKSVEAIGSYAENQKISAVRKVYQKGVVNPMTNIEQFWKDYMAYEQNINPIIAEKMGLERSRDYMNSRRVSKEFEAITRGLNKHVPSVPPTTHPDELRQVDLWKKYINWEKSNPMRTEDTTMMTRRVMFAYEQCLLCLGHHPDAWYEAAQFLEHSAKILTEKGDVTAAKLFGDEAGSFYERATTTLLNKNMLLYFAYCDFEESRHKYEKVHQIYSKYLDIADSDPTLAYIQYMKFTRRAEGIKSARTVFKRAREDSRSRFQVFVAAALMEYYCSKDKNIAFRIFELGLKKFSDNPDYILCYVDYLSHLNEDNNTRVLFERVLSSGSLDPEKSVEIWNRFLEFESNIGDLTSIVNVEKRRSAVLQQIKEFEGKETAQLVDRYKFFDLYPCSVGELKSIGYSDNTASRSSFHPCTGGSGVSAEREEEIVTSFARPDFSQMVPFKPKTSTLPGDHPAPGGVFPTPPAAAQLCTLLPPPGCFHGPFVAVDMLMDSFNKMTLPDSGTMPTNPETDPKLFELAKSVHWIVNEGLQNPTGHELKRRRIRIEQRVHKRRLDSKYQDFQIRLRNGLRTPQFLNPGPGYSSISLSSEFSSENDSEDDDVQGAPPANDIYRQRQQKRVK